MGQLSLPPPLQWVGRFEAPVSSGSSMAKLEVGDGERTRLAAPILGLMRLDGPAPPACLGCVLQSTMYQSMDAWSREGKQEGSKEGKQEGSREGKQEGSREGSEQLRCTAMCTNGWRCVLRSAWCERRSFMVALVAATVQRFGRPVLEPFCTAGPRPPRTQDTTRVVCEPHLQSHTSRYLRSPKERDDLLARSGQAGLTEPKRGSTRSPPG
ncbi:hypothetical protein ST47_g3721 [Ascochyta rabiei]|uniref:Uncharacterized protein n=1 Tax=Didymella rabiei TaxID=5454 RepID=A0A163H2A5_DIDRA|nr:hypothetical protein ST47_g3721 [Ascochyta rabiei]